MESSSEIRTGRHCVFNIHVHLVFVTKYRKKIFTKAQLNYMQLIFVDVCNSFESELVEFNGEKDHVHLLVNYPPKVAVSKLVNSLKGVSSRMLRKEFDTIHRFYWKGALWSPSYLAGSFGGAPVDTVRQFIELQNLRLTRLLC